MPEINTKNNLLFYIVLIIGFCSLLTQSCKKEPKSQSHETGSVIDIDGNTYKTVKIGGQWWMAENLKVKNYRNGSPIQNIQYDTALWSKDTTGAYCLYDNNSTSPGLLYNWYAVNNSKNIAPAGWHIPSDAEWKELETYLGMSQTEVDKTSWRGAREGEKLKIESPQGWTRYSDVWANNESGFTALAGSCRLFNGIWGQPGLFATGFWWSSSKNGNQVWYRYLDYKNANVFRYYGPKNYGFSIRCVKD